MISHMNSLPRCEKGATAVEFAIIAMPLIMVTVGTIEVGRALQVRNSMEHNTDRVERSILILERASKSEEPYIKTASGREILTTRLKGGYDSAAVGAPTPETVDGTVISFSTITLSENFQLLIPFLDSSPITMTVQRKVLVPPE